MGREELTPAIIDWNNDGKPDIVCGERTGAVDLFLNTSADPAQPTFDSGQQLKFGGQEKFSGMTTVTVGALTGNPKAPDLLIADSTNKIFFARNTGTPGNPIFSAKPVPLPGVNPWPKIQVPSNWCLGNPRMILSALIEPPRTSPD